MSEVCHALLPNQGVQPTQNGFSGQFFRIFEIKLFCFVVAVRDLVHGVEAIHLTYINC